MLENLSWEDKATTLIVVLAVIYSFFFWRPAYGLNRITFRGWNIQPILVLLLLCSGVVYMPMCILLINYFLGRPAAPNDDFDDAVVIIGWGVFGILGLLGLLRFLFSKLIMLDKIAIANIVCGLVASLSFLLPSLWSSITDPYWSAALDWGSLTLLLPQVYCIALGIYALSVYFKHYRNKKVVR